MHLAPKPNREKRSEEPPPCAAMPPSTASATAKSGIKLSQETVLATLSSYSADWRRALDFHHHVSSPPNNFAHTPATLALTISILGKHFEFSLARSLLLSSSSSSSSTQQYQHQHQNQNQEHLLPLRSLFNRLSAAHLVSDALSLFHHHSPPSLPAYHHLIDSLCDHGHAADAEHLALPLPLPSSLPPPFPADTKIHNMILRGWLKLRHWPRCRSFWQDMDAKGVPKDLHSYSIYMDFLSKSGKPWKALKLFNEMKKRQGWVIDAVAYNTAIQAAGLAEGADRAVRVLREMADAGCPPNSVSYNTVIKMFCREGRIREGYGFLHRMKKAGCEPNVLTYHCFFQYGTRPDEILWLFDRMVANACRPRMDTYVMLMKKFGRWGFLRPVFMVWKKMEEHGMSPDGFAYNAMIDALLQKGMVDLAKKYDDEMLEKGLSAKPRKELGTKYTGEPIDDDDGDGNAFSGVFS